MAEGHEAKDGTFLGLSPRETNHILGDTQMNNSVSHVLATPEAASMEELLAQQQAKAPKRNSLILGEVVSITQEGAWVDIGGKSESLLSAEEVDAVGVKVGDRIHLLVLSNENEEGSARVSAVAARSWACVQQLHTQGMIAIAVITRLIKSKKTAGRIDGANATICGLNGFIPGSHLGARGNALAKLVGTAIPVKILEADPVESRLILSRRMALEEMENHFFATTQPGHLVQGKVVNIVDFGAFIELPSGISGLLHRSEISNDRTATPSQLLAIGQELELVVVKIDPLKHQVCFSLKQATQRAFLNSIKLGQVLEGKVLRITEYGAFLDIGGCVDGLLHVSEMLNTTAVVSSKQAEQREFLTVGQAVVVVVIKLDVERKQVGLSMKNT